MGFDDLRLFQFYLGHPVPVFCEPVVHERLRLSFDYAFSEIAHTHVGAAPRVDVTEIDTSPFEVLGAKITPIRMQHGPRFKVLGFRIGNVAYCTDVSEIPESSMQLLQGLDTLVLDSLREEPHITHLSLDQATEIAQKLSPRQTYFTHCSCKVDYESTNAKLPDGIEIGYDGLQIDLV